MTAASAGPNFLSLDEVLLLHELAINEFVGKTGIRDRDLLESAVRQAEQGLASGYVHAFPFEMAAAYGFHLAKNHPFVDGNKRVAWSAIRVFLFKNGYIIRLPNLEQSQVVVDVAAGQLDKSGLAGWIERNAEKVKEQL